MKNSELRQGKVISNVMGKNQVASGLLVCTEHEKIVPCRVCAYEELAVSSYSSKEEDVTRVVNVLRLSFKL